MGPAMDTNWVEIWDADTHVLKSSLPTPAAEADRNHSVPQTLSSAPPSRKREVAEDSTDDEASQVTRLLQKELSQPSESPDDNISLAKRAIVNASKQQLPSEYSNPAAGEKRKFSTTPNRSPKRTNKGPQQMTAPAVNSRASANPSTVSYEGPSWSQGHV